MAWITMKSYNHVPLLTHIHISRLVKMWMCESRSQTLLFTVHRHAELIYIYFKKDNNVCSKRRLFCSPEMCLYQDAHRQNTMLVANRKAVPDRKCSSELWVQNSFELLWELGCIRVCVNDQQCISVCECLGGHLVCKDAVNPVNTQWDWAERQKSRP